MAKFNKFITLILYLKAKRKFTDKCKSRECIVDNYREVNGKNGKIFSFQRFKSYYFINYVIISTYYKVIAVYYRNFANITKCI